MKVSNVLDIIGENTNVYIHDILTEELLTWYDGKNSIGTEFLHYPVEHMRTTNNGGIVLNILFHNVNFDALSIKAKLKAIWIYVYNLFPDDDFNNVNDLIELENYVREFWARSEYTLDKYGNWYDEEFHIV